MVVPDHLHCVMELPPGDADFTTRRRAIGRRFSRRLPATERRSTVRVARGEYGIWQRRYGEHVIRDEHDFAAHMYCLQLNPVAHGHVGRVIDWPYSTFHARVGDGIYPADWAGGNGR
nr:D356 [uncultured bacterium]